MSRNTLVSSLLKQKQKKQVFNFNCCWLSILWEELIEIRRATGGQLDAHWVRIQWATGCLLDAHPVRIQVGVGCLLDAYSVRIQVGIGCPLRVGIFHFCKIIKQNKKEKVCSRLKISTIIQRIRKENVRNCDILALLLDRFQIRIGNIFNRIILFIYFY